MSARILTVFLFFAIANSTKGQPALVESDICPFEEGCEFTFWVVRSPLPAYAREGDTTSFVFTIPAGDSLRFHIGNMHIDRAGVVLVVRPIEPFTLGDTVFILSPTGLGTYNVRSNRGYQSEVDWFWARDTVNNDYEGIVLAQPQMSWWVMVSDSHNQTLWLRLINTEQYYGFAFTEAIEMLHKPFQE
jgi:hypothetical protein